VIANPNPLNLTLIHCQPVFTKILKRSGLNVRPVKNAEPQGILVSGLHDLYKAELRQQVAA